MHPFEDCQYEKYWTLYDTYCPIYAVNFKLFFFLIVWAILNRTRYEDESPEKVGIQRLVTKSVYKSAYPLHDGDYDYHDSEENSIKMNERRLLYLGVSYLYFP